MSSKTATFRVTTDAGLHSLRSELENAAHLISGSAPKIAIALRHLAARQDAADSDLWVEMPSDQDEHDRMRAAIGSEIIQRGGAQSTVLREFGLRFLDALDEAWSA